MKPSGIISLLTDFGNRDGYVAAMKAIVLGINPRASLIDLSHDIEPQNVQAGAFLLSTQSRWFPAGSVHVAVIDPGVGTTRRIIAVQTAAQFYLAPDNGLLDFSIDLGIERAVEITNQELWRRPVSHTFHGRDIFAPVAAHLSLGTSLQEIGTPVTLERRLPAVVYRTSAHEISGQVVYIDRFGNLITNIPSHEMRTFGSNDQLHISVNGRFAGSLRTAYAAVPAGSPVAVIGGFDRLEIGIHGGSAAIYFQAGIGAAVTVRKTALKNSQRMS